WYGPRPAVQLVRPDGDVAVDGEVADEIRLGGEVALADEGYCNSRGALLVDPVPDCRRGGGPPLRPEPGRQDEDPLDPDPATGELVVELHALPARGVLPVSGRPDPGGRAVMVEPRPVED